ncbi:MAG: hypothetical protein AABW63_02320 [Nanoarchaeota archaeon]
MFNLIKKVFAKETNSQKEINENDGEAFGIVVGTFEINDEPEQRHWRNIWGLSKDSGLSQIAVGIIIDRYKGLYFEESPFEIAETKFYRLTSEGLKIYNTLRNGVLQI